MQTILNKKSKIGLKPIPPTYNQDKTDGLVAYITEKEYKKREKSFLASVKQNSLSIVDDSVKANADFQYKSGMNPKIVRTTDGKCCEWCSKLAGTYDYYKVMNTGNNVFRRHANCECAVNYIPYKGKAVNVWTKKEVKKGYLDLLDTIIKKDYNDVEKYVFTSKVAEVLEVNGVEYNAVKKHKRVLSTDEIVERLSGGDMTKGSCASLSFAYTGNKAGLDVLDFRGGNSQLIFSRNVNICEIAKLDGVNSTFEKGYNDVKNASNLLKQMEKDKEFILITGRHASVVKYTNDGYLYLELQSNNDNGWRKLDTTTLRKRFHCTKSCTIARIKFEQTSYLIDVETLGKNKEFQKLLGYINTNVDKQMKGGKGRVK